jgi:hypothetical protein
MISTASEWDCTPSADAHQLGEEARGWLTDQRLDVVAPWLPEPVETWTAMTWYERLADWIVTHVKFGGPKRGEK